MSGFHHTVPVLREYYECLCYDTPNRLFQHQPVILNRIDSHISQACHTLYTPPSTKTRRIWHVFQKGTDSFGCGIVHMNKKINLFCYNNCNTSSFISSNMDASFLKLDSCFSSIFAVEDFSNIQKSSMLYAQQDEQNDDSVASRSSFSRPCNTLLVFAWSQIYIYQSIFNTLKGFQQYLIGNGFTPHPATEYF